MSHQDLLLAIGAASLAVVITLVDLLLSLRRHRRRNATAVRSVSPGLDASVGSESAREAKRGEIRRRLAAVQNSMAAAPDQSPPEPA